ncbi:TetR/AcrR family transcriptional regulator [Dactylosporangium cerinum]|uniref:TetR/AcrR family transcriptional regulator n=1 Tax=Dactylosporangium cerinum TaxID=1434730 RepID=A0ABV9VYS5_9ACTN
MAQRRLSAEDWTGAALAAIADGGLATVAVEPLAARLGATKGSFYWHFTNRDALIEATMQLWERACTDAIIDLVEAAGDPPRKLSLLFTTVLGHARSSRLETNVLAVAEHPLVGPVVQRVTRRRLDYVEQLFTEAGFEAGEARRRALLAYTAYVGQAQLAARLPELLPADATGQGAYLDSVLSVLLSPADG